jgi:hypothetical protein
MMRIAEILFCNNEPTEEDRATPQLHSPPAPFSDDATNLANAFTRSGAVKHFWNLHGSEAPPDAEPELIPSGTLEPTMAFSQDEPVEEEPPVGLHRVVPFPQYQGYQTIKKI